MSITQQINSYEDVMVEYTQRMLTTWQDGSVLDVHEAILIKLSNCNPRLHCELDMVFE